MMKAANDWVTAAKEVFTLERECLETVKEHLDGEFARAVEILAACTGRVVVMGLGKSGLVGRKIAATLSSTGTASFFLHPVEGAHGDLGSIREGDVVICISYSGKTAEVIAVMPALRSLGARLISITGGGPASPMAKLSDATLDVAIPKEACPNDLAPTSSTTATLVMGDALAVCLMHAKSFTADDFKKYHPGGSLGQRLRLKISEVMHTANLPMVTEEATIAEAVAVQDKGGLGAALVTGKGGILTGILTDGDIRRAVSRGTYAPNANVTALMTRNPRHGNAENSVAELLDVMEKAAITVLPVTDGQEKLVGVIHLHDLLGKGTVHFSV
ncbi:MAG: Arabinose 5-phosphate isomerase KdsD [Desulfovibrio sp.]